MMLDWSNPLLKTQAMSFIPLCIGNLFLFVALLTSAWQVAEDTDAHRYMQSGLWMYCPGNVPCWYIFSDNLVNYYEKVDVCRFLLIGWHYAVLTLLLFALAFGLIAAGILAFSITRPNRVRLLTIIFNLFIFLSFLFLSVGLAVFMINAEMLESRFLIGIKNTFELISWCYGNNIYIFTKTGRNYVKEVKFRNSSPSSPSWRSFMSLRKEGGTTKRSSSQTSSYPTIPVFQNVFEQPPRPGSNTISQTITPLPPDYMSTTRTFLSY
ncbi:Clc-like protein 5 [Dirofilaria immitis]|nr:Clc-like protein 5 [Dirofilaria immitis]